MYRWQQQLISIRMKSWGRSSSSADMLTVKLNFKLASTAADFFVGIFFSGNFSADLVIQSFHLVHASTAC
jgi:hypothetical protein